MNLVVYWRPEAQAWSVPECIAQSGDALQRAEEMVCVDERQEAAMFPNEIVDWCDPEFRVLAIASQGVAVVMRGDNTKIIYTISKKLVEARVKVREVQP